MKKVILMMALSLGLFACNNGNAKGSKTEGKPLPKDRVEILYFHGKQRCASCIAIEQNTKTAIEANFAEELKNGTVVFKSLDISEPENEKIADRYEISWSSLLICRWKDGKEKSMNLTEFAFRNARSAPDVFKNELTKTIEEQLK